MFFSSKTGGFYSTEIHGENIPAEAVEISVELHEALLAGQSNGKRIVADQSGYPVLANPPDLTPDQAVAQYEAALDAHLDSVARQHRYDNRITFSLRAGYAGPYQVEGVAFAQWMDECYVLSNQIKNAVIAGEQVMPSLADFIGSMPVFAV